ncbi:helix-turn-helix domain-containing protein [Methylobacterium sp. Leaf118]|uniref:helix-turn-helix domain-containing protein n=1 Tax=Methylobacterium sp. Leaf118 TaxID=2876562 RepID=UPI001E463651|nr:helix-turn-helix domain-containing protein [Methylobacterium sp. Leaf118]
MSDPSPKAGSPARFSLKVTRGAPNEFEMWRAAVSPMFEIAPLSAAEAAAFGMDTTGYFLPGLAITRTTSSGCAFERSRSVIARSGIENIMVQVYLEGGYVLDAEGICSEIHSGDVVAIDLRRECVIRAEPYANLALTVQRDMIAPMVIDMEKLHGLIIRNGESRNALLKSHMLMLHAEAPNIGVAEQSAVVQGTAALLAACLGPSLASREIAPSTEPLSTLQLIRRAIDSRLSDVELGPVSLAKQFGLSRASVYRLFEPLGGIRAYIQQRRLMHAYQLLTNPSHVDEQISAIARQVGFAQSTAFSRAFRSLYKMTPSDVRAVAQSGFISAHDEPRSGDASFWMLNRWLLGLDANGR